MSALSQRPYAPEVEAFHAELAAAARWVIAEGASTSELLDVIEKPWRWQVEATAAQSLEDALNGTDIT